MQHVIQEHREQVGRQVRKARKTAGMSHDVLAAKVGSSRQHLIKIEKGQHLPRPDLLAKIADATGRGEEFFASDDDDDDESDSVTLDDFLRMRIREMIRDESAHLEDILR